MMESCLPTPRRRGFTLLEMMLSVAVFTMLITSAFALIGAVSELMSEVSETQNAAAVRLRFIEACRTAFESTGPNSNFEFHYEDRGGDKFDTYLSLIKAPAAFDFGINLRDEIERVVIAAEIRPDGFIRSRVYYMTAVDHEEALQNSFTDIRSPYVELVPRMRQLSWRFYDDRNREWLPTPEGVGETNLVELTVQTDTDATPLRSVFYFAAGGGQSLPRGIRDSDREE